MPKLRGYRERLPFNIYDSVSPRDLLADYARLFSSKNIGHLVGTNVSAVGEISRDQYGVVANWYARTNMDVSRPEWQAWACATTVTFNLGCRPRLQLPLSDLIKRTEGGNGYADHSYFASSPEDQLARRDVLGRQVVNSYDPRIPYDLLPESDKERWAHVAEEGLRVRYSHIYVVIPVRQGYDVTIESDPQATRVLIETMAPQSLIWVHLEGITHKDVA